MKKENPYRFHDAPHSYSFHVSRKIYTIQDNLTIHPYWWNLIGIEWKAYERDLITRKLGQLGKRRWKYCRMVSQPRRVENTISRQRVEINFRGWETIVGNANLQCSSSSNQFPTIIGLPSQLFPVRCLCRIVTSSSRRFRIIATTNESLRFVHLRLFR